MDVDEFLKDFPCCACLKVIGENGSHVNHILVDRMIPDWIAEEMKWYPYWCNFFYYEFKGLQAIICDECLEKWKNNRLKIKFVVRWDIENKTVYYYDLERFDEVPLCYKCIYFDRRFHRNTKHFKCLAKRKVLEYVPKKRCKKFVDAAKAVEESTLILAGEGVSSDL